MTRTDQHAGAHSPIAGSHWDIAEPAGYGDWRAHKLAAMAQVADSVARVEISDLAMPSDAECAELVRRCAVSNSVFYATSDDAGDHARDPERCREQLLSFTQRLGLHIAETHRSAGIDGIVALQQTDGKKQRGYIPYSKKPMNWHTDGYYNSADQKIRGMVLHCVRPAADGGVNEFFDPEIAYLRLRDENPGFIAALMHPRAMTIPENREENGKLRPASIGPVFAVNSETGHLEMRYTARTRSITWRQDAMTQDARDCLSRILGNGDPFMQVTKLQPGEGILCNNSLHNRTGFDPNLAEKSDRLIFRIRFHNRLSGS